MENTNSLFIDIQKGDTEKVKAFLEGKDVNIADNFGRTVLMNAALYDQSELISWLLGKNADVNSTDKNGSTALHFAAQEGNTSALTLLIDKGADLNAKDKHGNTPAWGAIMNWQGGKNKDVLKKLVSSGADLTVKNAAGASAIELIPQELKPELGL